MVEFSEHNSPKEQTAVLCSSREQKPGDGMCPWHSEPRLLMRTGRDSVWAQGRAPLAARHICLLP